MNTKKIETITIPHAKPFSYEEGDYTVTRSHAWSAPGCHQGCGVLLYTDADGKLVKVEGDPEHPVNKGRLCIRCLDLPEVVYHEDRLVYPMKRAYEDRGKDKWERITWDEALDTIETKLKEIRDTQGPESVIFVHGTARDIAQWQSRLAWSFGTPNYGSIISGSACYLPRIAGCAALTGCFWVADCAQEFPDRYDSSAYTIPETMFIWGNNPLISNSDGFFGHWVIDLMKRGMKIVVVDPRVTWLASRAELYLPVRCGTDAALALAMANVIISENLYDHDFVDKWCYGFEEYSARCAEYSVEDVAEITRIPIEKIVRAARILAKSKPCTMQWGLAVDATKEALPAGQAIIALWFITGNVDVPGGIVKPDELFGQSGGWGHDYITPEVDEKRFGIDKYAMLRIGYQQYAQEEMLKTAKTEVPFKIQAAVFQTSNPLACPGADPKFVAEALGNIPFIVVMDMFQTPSTMALADIVLPCCSFAERVGVGIGCGTQQGDTINKAIEAVGECKSDLEFCLELGKRLRPEAWPWNRVEDMISNVMEPIGYTYEELQKDSPAFLPHEYKRYEKGLLRTDGQLGFSTKTGRIELWSTYYSNAGLDPLPYFEEPYPGPGSTPELMEEYPLILTTGARFWATFHSEHRMVKRLRETHPDPLLEVHPIACRKYGVKDGDWVWVENMYGRAKCRVRETTILSDPFMVSPDHAWWLPEADPENLFDLHDVAINNLIAQCNIGKSGFGANYKSNICKIYKCDKEN